MTGGKFVNQREILIKLITSSSGSEKKKQKIFIKLKIFFFLKKKLNSKTKAIKDDIINIRYYYYIH